MSEPIPSQLDALSRVPVSLSKTDIISGKRIYVAGGCILWPWVNELKNVHSDVDVEHYVTAGNLPDSPPHDPSEYAFVLAAIPRRQVSKEFNARISYSDLDAYRVFFEECVDRMKVVLDSLTVWSDRIPVFVLNLFVPQFNHMGRLFSRYDLRNPAYFTTLLNERLSEFVSNKSNVYIVDIDSIAASYGRQRIQDDSLWALTHGSILDAFDAMHDQGRLEEAFHPLDYFPILAAAFARLCWEETFAMYRTLKGADSIKMVCVDLDDTLWRGVMAEREFIEPTYVSGWPQGFAEALLTLKQRGIILCIVSKNDEARVRSFWHDLFGEGEIRIDDFAVIKINWRPKVDNILEAIAQVNVLASSVLFIDDNPVERASVVEGIPGIRTLGAPHYLWRDTLLRSSETQVAAITGESSRRSEMIRAQIEREDVRKSVSREEFLSGLKLRITSRKIKDQNEPRMVRALELVNKTNQFNTTGRRWSIEEVVSFFMSGGAWWTFEVVDKFTNYGLVGVVIARLGSIDQYVMSCRVLGMEVERAILASVAKSMLSETTEICSYVIPNSVNMPCQNLFRDAGWRYVGSQRVTDVPGEVPSHISMVAGG